MSRFFQHGVEKARAIRALTHAICLGCGCDLPMNTAAGFCPECAKAQIDRWERTLSARRKRAPKSEHIAGYVPPKGSIAQQFFGRVIAPIRTLGD